MFNRYFERSFEDIFKNLGNIAMTCKGERCQQFWTYNPRVICSATLNMLSLEDISAKTGKSLAILCLDHHHFLEVEEDQNSLIY